jgi:hypothetical protein
MRRVFWWIQGGHKKKKKKRRRRRRGWQRGADVSSFGRGSGSL